MIALNSQHKTIRALITTMSPKRAVAYIKAFELPEDEERYLIECDVRKKSCTQAAMEHNVSVETVKKKRRTAYFKISDEINSKEGLG